MGGRAFENLKRIEKENISGTVMWLGQNISLNYNYMMNNLMGSAGKQETSGDLDIAVDSRKYTYTQFKKFATEARQLLGKNKVKYLENQINMAVPIHGNPLNSLCQVDFIYGNSEWLKFTHWSPGELSNFKGVFISQTLGVLAKMKVIYRYPKNAVVDKDNGIDERLAEVAFAYNLEKGLHVRCRLRKNGGFKPVTPDEFETKCPGPVPPRVPRYGYIECPNTAIKILVGPEAARKDCATFENLINFVYKQKTKDEWLVFKERLQTSLAKSGARYFYEESNLEKYLNTKDK